MSVTPINYSVKISYFLSPIQRLRYDPIVLFINYNAHKSYEIRRLYPFL